MDLIRFDEYSDHTKNIHRYVREHLGLGFFLGGFTILGDVTLESYIESRFPVIVAFLVSEENDHSLRIDNRFICRVNGANDFPFYKESLQDLCEQDNLCPIDSSVLDYIGALINMHSYCVHQIPNIYVLEFFKSLITRVKKRKVFDTIEVNDYSVTDAFDIFRIRCSKITMFPFIFKKTFMVAVLLPAKRKCYVLSCNRIAGADDDIKVCLILLHIIFT